MKQALFLAVVLLTVPLYGQQQTTSNEWKAVSDALGRTGKPQPDGAIKFGMPRKDLKVTANGVAIKPGLALGSWAAFANVGGKTEAMGDLVLTETEVGPVMQSLLSSGIEVTALHNHLLFEQPRVMYMHFHGMGDGVQIARALREALGKTATPPDAPTQAQPAAIDLDAKQIDSILGHKGTNNGGIYQFAVARSEKIMMDGSQIPNSMGIATAINFQQLGAGKAAITGDFVLLASEVNPVMRALRDNGIAVTAVHSHMLTEEPRLFFMHFWAQDDALKLARGLRAALDKTHSAS
jgi:hypothetical protein